MSQIEPQESAAEEVKVAPKRGRKAKPQEKQGEPEPGHEALLRIPSVYSDDEIKRIQEFAHSIKVPNKSAIIAQKHIMKNKANKKFYCALCDYNAGGSSALKMHQQSKKHAAKAFEQTNSTLPKPQ